MNEQGIRDVLRAIGVVRKQTKEGEWVMTTCPLAPWRHAGGHDNSPSFGVHIEEGGTSIFNCFTCHSKGPLSFLVSMMEEYTGEDYKKLRKDLENNELFMSVVPDWDGAIKHSRPTPPPAVDEHMLTIYPEATADHQYLIERGITDAGTVSDLELRIDPDDKGTERLLFPVRGVDGTLYGFTGRATDSTTVPKVRDYFGLPKAQTLLGAHAIDSRLPVLLVEGLFDYAMLRMFGYQVLAVMHSSITEEQARILKEIGAPLYVFFDDDKAGIAGRQDVADKLRDYVPVYFVEYPEKELDQYGREISLDPARLYDDEVKDMLEDAYLA